MTGYKEIDEFENKVVKWSLLDKYFQMYIDDVCEKITPNKRMVVEPALWITVHFLNDNNIKLESDEPEDIDRMLNLVDDLTQKGENDMLEVIQYTIKKIIDSHNSF